MLKIVYFDYHGVLDRRTFAGLLRTIAQTAGSAATPAVMDQLTLDGDAYATGTLTPRSFWHRVEKTAGLEAASAGKKYILHVDPVREMWELLNVLHRRFSLGLLSDCPADKKDIIIRAYNLPEFFDYLVFSCEAGLSKQDASFFRLMDQDGLFQPSQILFIDDNEHNVALAQSLGYAAYHFVSPRDAMSYLQQL